MKCGPKAPENIAVDSESQSRRHRRSKARESIRRVRTRFGRLVLKNAALKLKKKMHFRMKEIEGRKDARRAVRSGQQIKFVHRWV